MTEMPKRIGMLVQGPIHTNTNGYSSLALLARINASPWRSHFHVLSVLWDDEAPEIVEQVRALVDEVAFGTKPLLKGAGNRNWQAEAVASGLRALEPHQFTHVLKTRHDFLLPDDLLGRLVEMANNDFSKVFVTNLYTKFESFHISDMLLFSTFEHVRMWYETGPTFYQDLYSAEVQFARSFVRNKGLPYPLTQEGYYRFLRDWIEMVDFRKAGVIWFKDPNASREAVNKGHNIMRDRDCGPLMHKLLPAEYPATLARPFPPLALRAVTRLVLDALAAFALIQSAALLRRVFKVDVHYFAIPLPGGRVLDVKIGFGPERYNLFSVDPDTREETKPIGSEAAVVPRVRPMPPPPGIRGRHGVFAFLVRRADAPLQDA